MLFTEQIGEYVVRKYPIEHETQFEDNTKVIIA
jgi:hypothetical protein